MYRLFDGLWDGEDIKMLLDFENLLVVLKSSLFVVGLEELSKVDGNLWREIYGIFSIVEKLYVLILIWKRFVDVVIMVLELKVYIVKLMLCI